jgi:2-dehydro-3-deoxy-D-gluconate 5-dehydrogenase
MLSKFSLSGKVALVTGCKKGIGFAIAEALAYAGADIIGVSATLELENSDIEKKVKSLGRRFDAYQCDFSDRSQLYAFIEKVSLEIHKIDILVNNAGTILRNPVVNHSDEYWDTVLEINLSAQFILTRALGAKMLDRGYGKVIFIASLLSFQGGINVPGYAASKGGISSLTKALANEWAGKGVNVNAIAPGYIETDNTEALRNDPDRSSSILQRIPANRWGKPDDFAGPAIFLASDASDYVHGTILTVDGGWMGR